MLLKRLNVYSVLITLFIVTLRGYLDFTWGDSEAFRVTEVLEAAPLRNAIPHAIFYNTKAFGEIVFSFLYYRNVFILADLITNLSPLLRIINKKILSFTVIISLLSPISILFTSFAGKDILAIFLSSILCIEFLKIIKNKKTYNLASIKTIYFSLIILILTILRTLTGAFSILLFLSILIYYKNLINPRKFILLIFIFLIICAYNFSDLIYPLLYDLFYYQSRAALVDFATFKVINPFFETNVYLNNLYQALTCVNLIHFQDSFIKSIALLFNSLINYLPVTLFNFFLFLRKRQLSIFVLLKIIFLASYFLIFAFLAQINPGAATRYSSSILPLLVTYFFIVTKEGTFIKVNS